MLFAEHEGDIFVGMIGGDGGDNLRCRTVGERNGKEVRERKRERKRERLASA